VRTTAPTDQRLDQSLRDFRTGLMRDRSASTAPLEEAVQTLVDELRMSGAPPEQVVLALKEHLVRHPWLPPHVQETMVRLGIARYYETTAD
jgi:hypothetical protein